MLHVFSEKLQLSMRSFYFLLFRSNMWLTSVTSKRFRFWNFYFQIEIQKLTRSLLDVYDQVTLKHSKRQMKTLNGPRHVSMELLASMQHMKGQGRGQEDPGASSRMWNDVKKNEETGRSKGRALDSAKPLHTLAFNNLSPHDRPSFSLIAFVLIIPIMSIRCYNWNEHSSLCIVLHCEPRNW